MSAPHPSHAPKKLRIFAFLLLAYTIALAEPARAQVHLEKDQSAAWQARNVGAIALLSAASVAILTDPPAALGARWQMAPAFERGVQQNNSRVTARVSDVTLFSSIGLPLATLYSARAGASYENSLILYGQVMSASVLSGAITKQVALRARPERVGKAPAEPDDHYSFYSGHSSLSFAAGVGGSALYSATETDLTLRSFHWAGALALASFTAHARVRAGRHYTTDVLVGALVGAGIGLTTPLLHGVDIELQEEEVAAAALGLFAGTVLGGLLPNRSAQTLTSFAPRLEATRGGMVVGASGRF